MKLDLIPTLNMVRENLRITDACPRHHFPHRAAGYRLGDKMRCANCGGEMSITDASNYVRGFIAAGGEATDIWPDWKPRA